MKVSELRDAYYEASAAVSDLVRKLAFAGIAVVWIFRVGDKTGGIKYFDAMLWPLGLFVASLTADFGQYLYKAVIWGALNHHYYKKNKPNNTDTEANETEVDISKRWNWPTLVFFWLKSLLTIVAYGFLLHFICSQLYAVPKVSLQQAGLPVGALLIGECQRAMTIVASSPTNWSGRGQSVHIDFFGEKRPQVSL